MLENGAVGASPSQWIEVLQANGIASEVLPSGDEYQNLRVPPDQIVSCLACLKDSPLTRANLLMAVTGSDLTDAFEVLYHVHSLLLGTSIMIKARITDRANPTIDSVCSIHLGANYHEREIFDLFGISFKNHPNMKRILLPEHWKGHPLRKDYVMDDERLSWNAR